MYLMVTFVSTINKQCMRVIAIAEDPIQIVNISIRAVQNSQMRLQGHGVSFSTSTFDNSIHECICSAQTMVAHFLIDAVA